MRAPFFLRRHPATRLPGRASAVILSGPERIALDGSNPFLAYWYFHLPNFVLAALMYTLIGRVLLGLIVQPDSSNYIWRFFCRLTNPFIALITPVTPRAAAPVVVWLFGVVWLFWLRVGLLYVFLLLGALPRSG